jgi:hypothetical protein
MRSMILLLACATAGCVGSEQVVQEAIAIGQASLAPTPGETGSAVKQALDKGVQVGIDSLKREGGFSQSVHKILLPKELLKTAEMARNLGFGAQVDGFERSMNRAAEQAMSSAVPIFKQAVAQLTFQDVLSIMQGGDQAATAYFRKTSEQQLLTAFRPIVAKATQQNNVGKLYTELTSTIKPAAALAGIPIATVNLDEYVSRQAAEALFTEIGKQEKKIRENPIERTSALLQKVFGYYGSKRSGT